MRHSYLTWYTSLPKNIKLSQTVWELWPVQDFSFRRDKSCLSCTATCLLVLLFIPTKYYQNISKGYQSYGAHKDASTYVTQQQKLSQKRAITQPKFGRWLPILNLSCILQWYIELLQTSNEINASLQKLLIGSEKCDDDAADANNADGQHGPCVSAMLHRQHKKGNFCWSNDVLITQKYIDNGFTALYWEK